MHGGGQTRHTWDRTGPRLATLGWRVIAPDLRGHGTSEWSADGDYDLDLIAGDVRAIVAELRDRPMLVGASLGGLSSALAAGETPRAAIRAPVLVDLAHRPDPRGARRIIEFMRHRPDGFASIGLLDAARHADVPILLVRGGISDVVRDDIAEEFCDRIPNAGASTWPTPDMAAFMIDRVRIADRQARRCPVSLRRLEKRRHRRFSKPPRVNGEITESVAHAWPDCSSTASGRVLLTTTLYSAAL